MEISLSLKHAALASPFIITALLPHSPISVTKVWYVYTMELFTLKFTKGEILTFAATWRDLENTTISDPCSSVGFVVDGLHSASKLKHSHVVSPMVTLTMNIDTGSSNRIYQHGGNASSVTPFTYIFQGPTHYW